MALTGLTHIQNGGNGEMRRVSKVIVLYDDDLYGIVNPHPGWTVMIRSDGTIVMEDESEDNSWNYD